jgi:hypothetical protein
MGILQRVPHPGLRGQMHDWAELLLTKQFLNAANIRHLAWNKLETGLISWDCKPHVLKPFIVTPPVRGVY